MTFVKTWTIIPPGRADDTHPWDTLTIREATASTGPWTVIDTQAWTDATPSTADAVSVETSAATLETGWYQFEWQDDTGAISRTGAIYDLGGPLAFATADDMLARMAVSEFDTTDAARVNLLLETATSLLAAAAGETDEWAAALHPVPTALRAMCIELVARVMFNPQGVASQMEQLGTWQHQASYDRAALGLTLTADERRAVRRLVTSSAFQALTLVSPYSGDDGIEMVAVS